MFVIIAALSKPDGVIRGAARHDPAFRWPDVGPDPIWGMAVFVVGVVVMAAGGAGNWHWTFNVGMGTLLLGVVIFTVFVGIVAVKLDRDRYWKPLRKFFLFLRNNSLIGRLVGRRDG